MLYLYYRILTCNKKQTHFTALAKTTRQGGWNLTYQIKVWLLSVRFAILNIDGD